jgi:glycosyltransferase involved in cell wall biosynthesis
MTEQVSLRLASPLVSVVLPAYNCARYIVEALGSVYRQTYDHWEVIVVDDGSTDDTRATLTPHLGRIRYLHHENQGACAARNTAVKLARGELIAFLDADDIWLPQLLELQVRVMQRSPECALVVTDGKTFTGTGVTQESVFSRRFNAWLDAHGTDDPLVAKGWMVRELSFGCSIAITGVMVRRECLEEVGGFDEQFVIAEDYDLWLRIARHHPVAVVRRPLFMYRWREDSQSGPIKERQHRWAEGRLRVMEKQLPLAPADLRTPLRAHMARLYWECARHYFGLDQFHDSRRMLVGCLRHDKTFVSAMMFLLASGLGRPVIDGMRKVARGVRAWRQRVVGQRFP